MLTLWYIVLGWKEYNKPFRRAEQPAKPAEPAKKPDLIPPRKDGPTLPTDIKKPEPPKSIPIDTKPSRDPAVNNRIPETPKISDVKPSFPSPKTPEVPKMPEIPKTPEPPKVAPKTPELPKMPEPFKATPKTPELPKMPEPFNSAPKTPELPKTPEMPKMPEPPKVPPRTPETPKMPEFKLAPELPKKPDAPKTPEQPFVTPKTPESPKVPDSPKGIMPSRRPESVMPEFPPSGKNPYFPQPNPSEFDLPPYLPGAPQNKPLSRDDELFSMGSKFNNPSPNKPTGNLRDLSYAKGEFPGEDLAAKVQETASRIPKYMEQSVISNPDSLESDEEDDV